MTVEQKSAKTISCNNPSDHSPSLGSGLAVFIQCRMAYRETVRVAADRAAFDTAFRTV
jgi:hypothetical protein